MKRAVFWICILVLILLHQDYWQWDKTAEPFFGFLPYPLAYHMGFSLCTALFWILAVKVFWPADFTTSTTAE